MHFRRFACLLLGAWLGGIVLVGLMATQNFRTVDRLLLDSHPAAAQELKTMGHDFARMLLRWQAGEENRWMFEVWESAQLALGLAVFFVLLFGSTESKFSLTLSLLLLVLVIVQRFALSPMMVGLGRLIDFVPPAVHSTDRIRFQVLHAGYMGMETAKFALGLVLCGKLLIRSHKKSSQTGGDFDVIDKAYHRHVDR